MVAKLHLEGQRFGRLTVAGVASGRRVRSWNCLCDCGGVSVVSTGNLRGGQCRSCGCATVEATITRNTAHGVAKRGKRRPRLYTIWKGMRQRCNDNAATNFKWYGARGIKVCAEWDSYEAFSAWATSSGYADHLELDRRENELGYAPGNCRWITHAQQMLNTRRAAAKASLCPTRPLPVLDADGSPSEA